MAEELKEKRTSADILGEIEAKLATIDGISTGDAFALGGLVREYGGSCAGTIAGDMMKAMIEPMLRKEPPKSPWEL